ncbi:MAG: 50S ribosomal protein L24 [Sedimentisphaerales bacterium]|nr:50S ribosomal protein L24 [Sedimentisphaerales bacterium]
MARHITKGMMVQIISGDNAGMSGEVMKVLPSKDRVLVKGINLAHKHVRPSQQNPQGGRIRVERPIHISNLLPLDKSGKGSRVRYEMDSKGAKKRVTTDGHKVSEVVHTSGKKK